MDHGLSEKDQQLLKSFLAESIRETGLLRYHSLPSNTLAGLVAHDNHEFMSSNGEFGRLLGEDAAAPAYAVIEAKSGDLRSDESLRNNAIAGVEQDKRLISHARFKRANVSNNSAQCDLLHRVGTEVQSEDRSSTADVFLPAVMQASSSNPLPESFGLEGMPVMGPSFYTTSSFIVGKMCGNGENGDMAVPRMPMLPNQNGCCSLLQQSSSPEGLITNIKGDYTSNAAKLPSSSLNSPEQHSLDRTVHVAWEESGGVGSAMVNPSTPTSLGAKRCILEFKDKSLPGSKFQGSSQLRDNLGNNTLSHLLSTEKHYLINKLSRDAVPCRSRAKRGCATHPRSIAERVRRTKISKGMRRLQELVPNMDKQTNIAEMLDEAVEYVKLLQQQVHDLKERESKCTCLFREKCSPPD